MERSTDARPWSAAPLAALLGRFTEHLSKHRRLAGVALAATFLLLLDGAVLGHALHGNPAWRISTDFGVYLQAAHAIARGSSPYSHTATPGVVNAYAYPPLFAEALLPLMLLGDTVARYSWLALSGGCLAGTIVLLGRGFGVRIAWPWLLLALAIVCAAYPVRNDLYHGEANLALLFLSTVALWLLLQRRPVAAGFAWGLVIAVKPFCAIVLVYLLWRRQWRAAISTVASSGVLVALSFAPTLRTGTATVHGWIDNTRYDASAIFTVRPDCHALHALLLRLFAANGYTRPWIASTALLQAETVILLALLALTVAVGLGTIGGRDGWDERAPAWLLVESGLVLGAGLAYGPLTEGDHLFLLIPAAFGVFLIARRFATAGSRRAWWWAATAWAALGLCFASPFQATLIASPALSGNHPHGLAILWTGRIGLVLLAALLMTASALRRTALDLRVAYDDEDGYEPDGDLYAADTDRRDAPWERGSGTVDAWRLPNHPLG